MKYLLKNKTRQGLNLTLKTTTGKTVSALLPALGTREINAIEMSQYVQDMANRGHLTYEEVHEPAPKKK